MSGHPEHVGQDYLSELPKLIVAKIRITVIQSSVGHLREFRDQIGGIPKSDRSRHGIIPAVRKRITAQNTPGCQQAALQKSVFFNSLDCII